MYITSIGLTCDCAACGELDQACVMVCLGAEAAHRYAHDQGETHVSFLSVGICCANRTVGQVLEAIKGAEYDG